MARAENHIGCGGHLHTAYIQQGERGKVRSVAIGKYCTGCQRFWPQKAPYWFQDDNGAILWTMIPEKDWPPNPYPNRGYRLETDENGVIVAVHAPSAGGAF